MAMVIFGKNSNKIKISTEDKILYTVVNIILVLVTIAVLYPLIYIVSSSFSSGRAITSGRVFLWPVEPTLAGYKTILQYRSVLTGYRNTIIYTVCGTLLNVGLTLTAAYALSRKRFQGRKICTILFILTMFFSGGLIPSYILITQLNLINTMWAIILPSAISNYNLIITRTFFMTSIPEELYEASQIDGCNDFRYFFSIVLPLSKAIIAVIALFYGVAHWNSWFRAMLYIRDPNMQPLQLVLRSILIIANVDVSQINDPELIEQLQYLVDLMKYSLIVVATIPVVAVYPLVQRYFIKGVMIGSLKG